MARPIVICDECHAQYPLNIVEQRLEVGVIDVGHQCPRCRFFTHSFYTNILLKEKQAKLARYRQAAHRGPVFLARYERVKAEYQFEHDEFNGKVGAQRLEALAATVRLGMGLRGVGQGEVRLK